MVSGADGGAVVEVHGLRKAFGSMLAVNEVSFAIQAGRSLAIVGESGSGKSTIAKILSGLERADGGSVTVCGHDRTRPGRGAHERRRRGRELQIVFQDPYASLDPRQRAGSCITEIMRVHQRLPARECARQARKLAEMVGLDGSDLRAYPRGLSGGQRQRVAIARALAADPRVIVMDEAVASLDVSVQAQVLNLIADLRERTGTTIIFISHDLAVVRQVTDDIVVMRRGEIVERGVTAEVLDAPQHEYTRLLRASVPSDGWRPSTLRGASTA